ncbi:TcpQ domain-containing protein [Marinobacterium jannaschii]|uniref:TcpQ domain-containing protein n=1 Tax=Marinobacterium jannaschii TaxID=64970 RepID=UPI000487AA6D|nr:TcpQ domain-containing protein [Marinobacterium jannaschii]
MNVKQSITTLFAATGLAALTLTACTPVEVKPDLGRVEALDTQIMLKLKSGYLEDAIKQVGKITGLSIIYKAEPHLLDPPALMRGEPMQVISSLLAGLPIRARKMGQTVYIEQIWSVKRNSTVKSLMQKWDSASEWSVVWNTQSNQQIQADAQFYGEFDSAVEELFAALRISGGSLEPAFYPNNTVVVR